MRTRLPLAGAFLGTLALAAATAPAQAVSLAPDLIVSVREDRNGADLVSIAAARSDYPPALLQKQIAALGSLLGGARGIIVRRETFRPGDPAATIVKGSCGLDGLMDGRTGVLTVVPLAQAFAAAPEPFTVRRMLVSFDGVRPTNRTLVSHSFARVSDLAFTGRLVGSSIEYRVEMRSQDPARLVVNEPGTAPARPPAPPPRRGPDPLTVALLVAAVVAAGALVYCLLLLLGRRPVAKP